MISESLDTYFPKLAMMPELKKDIMTISKMIKIEAGTVILKQGAYIKIIPLLISGLAKVFKEDEDGHEVLVYYIKPGESCVMSVTTLVHHGVSQVKAVIEEDAEVVVIPADKAMMIAKKYPQWNEFMYDLFNIKFEELLTVIKILTFSNKDIRLLEYLKKEAILKKSSILHTTHQQIAYELGSSREVISRLLKKLESEGAIALQQGSIQVL
ncbi:Crp/Fnr family transcriptional regulator [uncultured Dokdonia sp.]|uniref:Crp/Fnr family transcriptional regulator n=1 Tax=uncultured Dokdonia sp. TaxID=575653 RepID=UPI0026133758|nr:Crp/Fnr family transcriptional regulator [uncultured Dokdonia sp.]